MRSIPVDNTKVYRWLLTQENGGQRAYGPYSKRIKYNGVTWNMKYVELQKLECDGRIGLEWVTINKFTKEELNG